jgi:hypothetical protein
MVVVSTDQVRHAVHLSEAHDFTPDIRAISCSACPGHVCNSKNRDRVTEMNVLVCSASKSPAHAPASWCNLLVVAMVAIIKGTLHVTGPACLGVSFWIMK